MKLVQQPELELILSQTTVESCVVVQTADGGWTFVLRVRNPKDGQLVDYRLVSQRGKRREWSDPRGMFRYLKEQYHIKTGHFELR